VSWFIGGAHPSRGGDYIGVESLALKEHPRFDPRLDTRPVAHGAIAGKPQ
jgi:hypothetical protein